MITRYVVSTHTFDPFFTINGISSVWGLCSINTPSPYLYLHTLDCYICNKRSWNLTALRKLQSYIGLTMDLLVRLWHPASNLNVISGGAGCASISTTGKLASPGLQQTGLILFFGDEEIQKAIAAICSWFNESKGGLLSLVRFATGTAFVSASLLSNQTAVRTHPSNRFEKVFLVNFFPAIDPECFVLRFIFIRCSSDFGSPRNLLENFFYPFCTFDWIFRWWHGETVAYSESSYLGIIISLFFGRKCYLVIGVGV